MSADSVSGPVGLAFYKAAWSTTKGGIMGFLHTFHTGAVDLQRINKALIVMIPKKEAVVAPGNFRPMSLQTLVQRHTVQAAGKLFVLVFFSTACAAACRNVFTEIKSIFKNRKKNF